MYSTVVNVNSLIIETYLDFVRKSFLISHLTKTEHKHDLAGCFEGLKPKIFHIYHYVV